MIADQLHCPASGAAVGPARLVNHSGKSSGFSSCDRRCEPCGVGFSNGSAPTTIHRDPRCNVPFEVRAGAADALARSLNVRNRASKLARFGYSTSEDAITWTVFSWLGGHRPIALAELGGRLFGGACPEPAVLLWGVPLVPQAGEVLRTRIIEVLDALGERPASRTEPDVVLDFGPRGLVFIEVKHRSGNDSRPEAELPKFARYLTAGAFARPDLTSASRLYELARNWRVGVEVAGGRPFRLVNLGAPTLFTAPAAIALDTFEASLPPDGDRGFVRLTWSSLLYDRQSAAHPLPLWLKDWLQTRGLTA